MSDYYLPLKGEIPRKRRRKWKRQVLRRNPGLNPEYLDARYRVHFWVRPGAFDCLDVGVVYPKAVHV